MPKFIKDLPREAPETGPPFFWGRRFAVLLAILGVGLGIWKCFAWNHQGVRLIHTMTIQEGSAPFGPERVLRLQILNEGTLPATDVRVVIDWPAMTLDLMGGETESLKRVRAGQGASDVSYHFSVTTIPQGGLEMLLFSARLRKPSSPGWEKGPAGVKIEGPGFHSQLVDSLK